MNRPPLPPRRCTTCAATVEHHAPGLPCSPAPDRPSRLLVAALVLLALAGLIGLTLAPHHQPAPVTEDSPGWDCHTMGNRECGP